MKVPNHFDEEALGSLLSNQKRLAWDLESSIPWKNGVDFDKPFVPLDNENIFFGQISPKERLAISQYMGMMIAATISEMEFTMLRLREICWRPQMQKYAVNPELISLGENFFEEESKHAHVFQRFLDLCAEELKVDPETLKEILPRVNPGYVDKVLRLNAKTDGAVLWWITATVEEESTLIYKMMKPHRAHLDPLYFVLHQRHFEEEARHAPYPFLMLELAHTRIQSPLKKWLLRTDFVISEVLKIFWMCFELSKTLQVSHLKTHHPFFATLDGLLPKLKEKSLTQLITSFAKETPYLSSFINPLYHPYTKKELAKRGLFRLPMPEPEMAQVGWE